MPICAPGGGGADGDALEAREANVEGEGEITMAGLVGGGCG